MAVIALFMQTIFAAFVLHVEMRQEAGERDLTLFWILNSGIIGGWLYCLRDLIEVGQ